MRAHVTKTSTPRASWPRLLTLGALLVLLQCVAPHSARAWWNSDWPYRMKVDADTTAKGANVAAPIGHMQLLLRLHSGNFNFATAKDDGSDLRVVAADDKTPLHFQIEHYDGLIDQVGLLWIDVPVIGPNAVTSAYVYWGNKNATNGSDGKATFAAENGALVYHFDEQDGLPHDTTANANNATGGGKRVDGGMIGSGLRLDGKAAVQIPASASLALAAGQPVTWSLWIHPDDNVTSGVLYDQKDGANELLIGIDNRVPYIQITTASGTQRSTAGPAMPPTGWHLIDVTASDHVALFVDGVPGGQLAGALPALHAAAVLGGAPPAAPVPSPATPPDATAVPPPPVPAVPPNFVGLIDEFRVLHGVEAVGVMQTRVKSEGPSPNLMVLETPEENSIFGSGYLGIILKSVTPDAWVVIFILGVMSLISWVVMVGKGFYVSTIARANVRFRTDYDATLNTAHGDVLDVMRRMQSAPRPAWRNSNLFRLNNIASTEITQRVDVGRLDADGTLPARSIAAIRSALDGRMVVEVQHLNRMMVLLTIAIAGGPFIGLLGTVIGVMITFAAIAQAGDVNVNAIAPGISAALLATVAGLAVAIPALFGYNYFNTRIADVISDMNVHIDTLVTRMGEGLLGHGPQAGE